MHSCSLHAESGWKRTFLSAQRCNRWILHNPPPTDWLGGMATLGRPGRGRGIEGPKGEGRGRVVREIGMALVNGSVVSSRSCPSSSEIPCRAPPSQMRRSFPRVPLG